MPNAPQNSQSEQVTTAGAASGSVARILRSKVALTALAVVAALAVAGTSYGYVSMSNDITLTVDGKTEQVSAMGGTVEEVLDDEGIDIGQHDEVNPSLDEAVENGSAINVRLGRPVELTVDGDTETHWVTATDVASALGEIGPSYDRSLLSTSRSDTIGRSGVALEVITPKNLTLKIAGKKAVKRELTALTVEDALEEMDVKVDKRDQVKPALDTELTDGDKVVFNNIRVVKKNVEDEGIAHGTVEREDDSALEGETSVVREGRDGARDVTYRLVYRNGEVQKRTVLRQQTTREAVAEIVEVGTREPAPSTPSVSVAGGSVWDRLAACESGGNWSINTGNGYYGGLQFNLQTWQAYGGTGLPSNNSREQQIAVATKLRDATGGYGSWPSCSSKLGLPQ